MPTVARGRAHERRMESATAMRMGLAGVMRCSSSCCMKASKSSTVTRPPAPLPATEARSAALMPSSCMRPRSRGEI